MPNPSTPRPSHSAAPAAPSRAKSLTLVYCNPYAAFWPPNAPKIGAPRHAGGSVGLGANEIAADDADVAWLLAAGCRTKR
jgi:hypothetical protein